MPAVPYSPLAQVAPQANPTPYLGAQAPAAAFGGAVAEATEHLGRVASGAGSELLDRAIAMQQLTEQAKASESLADFTTQLGQMQAEYGAKQGKDAVDSYQPYIDSVNKLRGDMRESMTSPFAQQYFDRESRFQQSRAVFSGASHAASQNKIYAMGAAEARIGSATNSALVNPEDQGSFDSNLQTVKEEVGQQAVLGGWSNDRYEFELQGKVSKLWVSRIQGIAKSAPFDAQKLLDQATKEGKIAGQDLAAITDYVKKQQYTTGARVQASEILDGNGAEFGAGPVSMDKAKLAIGTYESNNNYALVGPETKSMGHALGKYQVMSVSLSDWLKEAGMPNMSEAEFLKSPDAQDKLFEYKFGGYMQKHGSFNTAAKVWFTGSPNPKPGVTDATATTKGHTVDQYLAGTNKVLARNATGAELQAAVDAKAKAVSPDDPMYGDYLGGHVSTLHANQTRIQRENDFNNRQVIEESLMGTDGEVPTSVDELTNNPDTKAAWDAMKPSDQRKYMKTLAQNAKGDYSWSEQSLKTYQTLMGAAVDPNRSPEDTQKFIQTDMTTLQMPISARLSLMKQQAQLMKRTDNSNPAVSHALGVLGPMLTEAGIDRKDKETWNQFVGTLHQTLMDNMAQKNGAMPNDKDIQVMGSRLLQKVSQPWFFGLINGTAPFYSVEVPKEARAIIVEDWKRQTGVEPTDGQIQSTYTAAQFQTLYGKKPPTTSPKPGAQVPTSR